MQTMTIEVLTADGEVKNLDPVVDKEAIWKIFSQMMKAGFVLKAGSENWIEMTAKIAVAEPHEPVEWERPQ